jgi:hypothetical protein
MLSAMPRNNTGGTLSILSKRSAKDPRAEPDELQNYEDPHQEGKICAAESQIPARKALVPRARRLALGVVRQLDQVLKGE